jgi:hypothetical protein
VTASIIEQEYNFRGGRGTGCFVMASLQRRHCTQIRDDIGKVGLFQAGMIVAERLT